MIRENEFNIDPNENSQSKQIPKTVENIGPDQEYEKDMEDFYLGDDDKETDEDYGRSGEKYGWYNGYSDDVIDDAFEGDPENPWNVD